ncbi:hypothetical protein YTPLAS18_05420 [Nitrospira sp.]|nr:hypothetical protein YTPLAS18_05420 [Nitrospira sp.]
MDLFLILIVAAVVLAPILFVGKMIFFGFLMKQGIDAYRQHQEEFNRALSEQQYILQDMAKTAGRASPGQAQQLSASFMRAQRELNQMDDLRRQQSELRLADMKSQAASVGVFLD